MQDINVKTIYSEVNEIVDPSLTALVVWGCSKPAC